METMDSNKGSGKPGPKLGTATRRRGKIQVRKILNEARAILIEEGYAGLTIRKVARNLDISLGNLTYYFPNKDELLRALIADLLDEYHRAFLEEQERFPDDADGRFLAYLKYLITDCRKASTRAVFFQIWGLATHSDVVNELRDEIYSAAHNDAKELIAAVNPTASASELNTLTGIFISLIEGLHVIADLNPSVLDLPPEFESQFRNTMYRLMTQGLDSTVQHEVNKHLPTKLRKY